MVYPRSLARRMVRSVRAPDRVVSWVKLMPFSKHWSILRTAAFPPFIKSGEKCGFSPCENAVPLTASAFPGRLRQQTSSQLGRQFIHVNN